MDLNLIITIVTALGLGSFITAIVSHYLIKSKEVDFKKREQKERRYRSIMLYMDVYFNPENIKFLASRQPDISSRNDVIEYLKAEYHEMILYSSNEVLLAVKAFIASPTYDNFLTAVLEMRADLWIKRSDIAVDEIKISIDK